MDATSLLEEVQAIARNGLAYAQNDYDRERYERLLSLAGQTYATSLDLLPGAVRERFSRELGYITPKVGGEAAMFNQGGELLLMERSDGSGWCLPCGWTEANERPADTAVRETREETGLEVEVRCLVGVFSRKAGAKDSVHSQIAVLHLCEVVGGELTLSREGLDLRYWRIEEVPKWHGNHEEMARAAYVMWVSNGTSPAVSK